MVMCYSLTKFRCARKCNSWRLGSLESRLSRGIAIPSLRSSARPRSMASTFNDLNVPMNPRNRSREKLSPRSISNPLIVLESSWNATRFNFFNCHVTCGKSGHDWIVSIHSLNCHLTGSKSGRKCLKFIRFQNDWISIETLWSPVNRNRQISNKTKNTQ